MEKEESVMYCNHCMVMVCTTLVSSHIMVIESNLAEHPDVVESYIMKMDILLNVSNRPWMMGHHNYVIEQSVI